METNLKDYNRRADNTVTTVYQRFMEHFWEWDEGKMENKEWEVIRRGFEAQGKILSNLIRVLMGTAKTPDEFKQMCVGFGIVPDIIKKLTNKKAKMIETNSNCTKCGGALVDEGKESNKVKCINCAQRFSKDR